MFEDEASFWLDGILHQTWARIGVQPHVDTYGMRKTAHVFRATLFSTPATATTARNISTEVDSVCPPSHGPNSLAWYAGVRISTIVRQARDNRAFERLVAKREAARAQPGGARTAAAAETSSPGADEQAAPPPPDSVIGRVEVPRLGIIAIVREGTEPGTLRHAVGHVSDTGLPGRTGNAALAGHRDTFFRKLKEVRAGDRVVVTCPTGG